MLFLAGLWHMIKVMSAAGYWLLSIGLLWAGFILMGSDPRWGWACFSCVLAVFALRGLVTRNMPKGGGNVLACLCFGLFLAVAAIVSHYDPGALLPQT